LAKILVTGGAGYCGSVLVPKLLNEGHEVTVYDTFWFGRDSLKINKNLNLVTGDIRDINLLSRTIEGNEVFINLACISNDASFELNESLSTSINLDAFEPMVLAAKKLKIKRFIYASSSSVYGVSDEPEVTENHPLVPLTLYNKYKGMCEPILLRYIDADFTGVVFRPATVCGYSPRQRLDVSVNILTNLAINKLEMTVFGGNQRRPNIHIKDYADIVELLVTAPSNKIQGQIFNVGNQNLTIDKISETVKNIVESKFPEKGPIKICHTSSSDNRSYHINSDKLFTTLGFRANRTIEDAISEMCDAFTSGLLPNSLLDSKYFNVKLLKEKRII